MSLTKEEVMEALKLEKGFTAGPLSGFWACTDTYMVKSYNTIIAKHNTTGRYVTATPHSQAMGRHMGMVRTAWADRDIETVTERVFVGIS